MQCSLKVAMETGKERSGASIYCALDYVVIFVRSSPCNLGQY